HGATAPADFDNSEKAAATYGGTHQKKSSTGSHPGGVGAGAVAGAGAGAAGYGASHHKNNSAGSEGESGKS
ncbi:hypothetical protein OGATHE_001509, partial [Ogataea polymorpha]